MSQPLHHSFILRPANTVHAGNSATMTSLDHLRQRQDIPPNHRPHLTLLRNKTLTSPPQWSRRRCPKPTQLFVATTTTSSSNHHLRAEFEPPTSPTYWKERCLRFQDLCQSSRKRLREMEEDQRQLRRRIHYLEERLTTTAATSQQQKQTKKEDVRSVTPCPGEEKKVTYAGGAGVPSMIVTDKHQRECFYMADCEGMSDSEYGEHYCTFEEDENEEDGEEEADEDEEGKLDGAKIDEKDIPVKKESTEQQDKLTTSEVEQRDDEE